MFSQVGSFWCKIQLFRGLVIVSSASDQGAQLESSICMSKLLSQIPNSEEHLAC